MMSKGFSLLELMVTIVILGLLITIGIPSLSDFTVRMRVDREIGDINRLMLTARNNAVNSGIQTTVCPLVSGECTTDWHKELTVFTDTDGDKKFEPAESDIKIAVKNAANGSDSLTNSRSGYTYGPDGTLVGVSNGTFLYCPKDKSEAARAIVVSKSGRTKKSLDTNNNGIENHPSDLQELNTKCPST